MTAAPAQGQFAARRPARRESLPAPTLPAAILSFPTPAAPPLGRATPPQPGPSPSLPGPTAAPNAQPSAPARSPWPALALSAALHASAALALIAAAPFAGIGASGEAGQDNTSLPAPPPSLTVEFLTEADLLPDTPPQAPQPDAPQMAAPDLSPQDMAAAPPALPDLTPADPPPSLAAPAALAELSSETSPAPQLAPPPPAPLPKPEKAPAPAPEKPAQKAPKKPAAAEKPAKAKSQPAAPAGAKAAGTGAGTQAGSDGKAKPPGPSKAEIADLKSAWGAKILSRVERKRSYPPEAAGASGTVKLQLTLSPAGALLAATITASSGNAALDRAALRAAKSAAPYPKAPKGLTDPSYKMSLRLRFDG